MTKTLKDRLRKGKSNIISSRLVISQKEVGKGLGLKEPFQEWIFGAFLDRADNFGYEVSFRSFLRWNFGRIDSLIELLYLYFGRYPLHHLFLDVFVYFGYDLN
jgi:hypothetical protein